MKHDRKRGATDRPSVKKRHEGEQPDNPAGPHAKPELTNYGTTPGACTLPDDDNGNATIG